MPIICSTLYEFNDISTQAIGSGRPGRRAVQIYNGPSKEPGKALIVIFVQFYSECVIVSIVRITQGLMYTLSYASGNN